ncbi:3-oxoacyl-ACP synthase III family protein [Streptomyces sp. SID12501]|uniref:3-oxoacyl-ACP synthase III family protein n=1 Tax=Streptomyces sp. SID12501 TaxID=2706042 RepID=A0A6B3C767_9ACTN|nr:3-oxoacyl-ACP synthase III family protein [Streptomyces sp. SID12501]NEC92254.1 3-oxoacyl-ACP synthase III family protein [Streptomyces sp. SID12501]
MTSTGAGISAIALEFPTHVRRNDFWERNHPELVANKDNGTYLRVVASSDGTETDNAFDIERRPYLSDTFRGARERRVIAAEETAIDLEQRALQGLCRARGIDPAELDAVMVHSWLPDTLGPQNAAHLTARLGLRVPAWNFESACNSVMVGLQTAAALVRAGDYERIALITSITSSRNVDPSSTLSWFLGDGCGALLIERCPTGRGIISSKVIGTQETCGVAEFLMEVDEMEDDDHIRTPRIRMRMENTAAGRIMRDSAEQQLTTCVRGALDKAGYTIDDVDFLVVNTPVAWFAAFCARALGVDPEKTVSTFGTYANIGPVLTTANLFEAASTGRIKAGDVVVLFGIGSVSTAGAAVVVWGDDVALGPHPVSG